MREMGEISVKSMRIAISMAIAKFDPITRRVCFHCRATNRNECLHIGVAFEICGIITSLVN